MALLTTIGGVIYQIADFDMACDVILKEYELLYTTYENYNQQSLTLKGWSATVGLAAILAIYSEKIGKFGRTGIVAAAVSVIPFWITDAFWKSYQIAFLGRIESLEKITNCSAQTEHSFGIVSVWRDAYSSWDWLGTMYLPNVALPHAFILILGMYLAVFHPPR